MTRERVDKCAKCDLRNKVPGAKLGLVDGNIAPCYETFQRPDMQTLHYEQEPSDLRYIFAGIDCPQGYEDRSLSRDTGLEPQTRRVFLEQNRAYDLRDVKTDTELIKRVQKIFSSRNRS